MSATEKTLSDLKSGDEVAIRAGMSRNYHLHTIKEVSRGIITLQNGKRYRASNGSSLTKEKGRYSVHDRIELVTDQVRLANRKDELASRLAAMRQSDWEKMDIATLEAVVALIWKEEG